MSKKPVAAGKSSFDLINRIDFFSNIKIQSKFQLVDLACGVGHYSVALSNLLDEEGLIYAVDLWDEGIGHLKETIKEKHIVNIQPIQADITKPLPLDGESIDLCLMATILHDLSPEEQSVTLKEVARVLKPEAALAIIEFKKIDRGPGPPLTVRISEQELEKCIEKFGFTKSFSGEIGEFNYLLIAQKQENIGRLNFNSCK